MTATLVWVSPAVAEQLAAIRDRLDAATRGPWEWGPDWATLDYQGREGGGDKYADLQLRGADGKEILPIRIDHYEPIWDGDPTQEPKSADRDLIAHAPSDIAFLLSLLPVATQDGPP